MTRLTIPDVIDKFRVYHDRHAGWGSLHIVLADGNIEDSCIDYCIGYASDANDTDGELLAHILRNMSKTQRSKISRIA